MLPAAVLRKNAVTSAGVAFFSSVQGLHYYSKTQRFNDSDGYYKDVPEFADTWCVRKALVFMTLISGQTTSRLHDAAPKARSAQVPERQSAGAPKSLSAEVPEHQSSGAPKSRSA